MDVSIIVVNWNTEELLRECLTSIYEKASDVDFEIIVVDNASTDGSVGMVKKDFPQVTLIENSLNLGFAAANNQGIARAKGRYVLLLNSDTIVLDNAITKTVRFANAHPEVAVVGCRVLNPDRNLQPTCFMFPSILNMLLSTTYLYKLFPRNRFFGREQMTWWDRDDIREVDVVTGCFMLVRREAIEQVGMMDERFFVYGEEADWCYRFRKNGWKILFTAGPEIIHYGGQTSKQMTKEFKLQLYGSRLIFVKLHRNKLVFPFACFLTALFFLLRVPCWLAVAMFRKNERKRSVHACKTYLVGGFYCLTDWKKLLMNKEAIKDRL